jgi:hypothetical protein
MKGITDRAATPKRIFFFVLNPRERCDLTLPLKGELNMFEYPSLKDDETLMK